MTALDRVARHRLRLGAAIALALVLAWLLAGCSSSDDAGWSTSGGGDAAFEDSAEAMDVEDRAAAEESGEIAAPQADRSVIVTGALYITVEDPIDAAERATRVVRDAGGRVDSRSETAPDEYYGGSAWLTLRIPADALDRVVDDLRDLGDVNEYSTSSYDVTREVTDLDAQISTLRASTQRIEALLDQAEDIDDIIALESELDRRQAELESLEARQRGLDDQVSMSTIELSLTTEPVVIVDDSPRSFWSGLVSGWDALVGFLSGALVVAGVLLPWIALAGLIAIGALLVVRARRSRKRAASDVPEPVASED
ncbi:DUF4349 domain-containing protein [uncultured Demequina sp.]|uniref:DUF4349 domain-containing protein n=1 Tax=uncultured Demequina sp. TaxID=693499 RepID=UPI0025D984BD|nr:DUF4349 domain-containing protein [uncultured Demequina sp.]